MRRTSTPSSPWPTAARANYAEADLASAQAALARGDTKTARELAARAKTRFPTGSPGWVKSDDIVGLKQPSSGGPANQFHLRPGAGIRPILRKDRRNEPLRLPCSPPPRSAFAGATAVSAQTFSRAAARRDREDHQGVSAEAPGGAAGGDGRAGEAPGRRRGREGTLGGQEPRRGDLQFAAPGHARQSAGRRHLRRVLRLQLRLLQARARRHDRADGQGPEAQGRAEGIPGARAELDRGRPGRGRGAHAGQDRQEVSRLPPEAARPAAARPTGRARSRSPRRSGSTWRGSRRT